MVNGAHCLPAALHADHLPIITTTKETGRQGVACMDGKRVVGFTQQ